jgi:hypothetical protein
LLAFPIVGIDGRRQPTLGVEQPSSLAPPQPDTENGLWLSDMGKQGRPPRQDECESGGC